MDEPQAFMHAIDCQALTCGGDCTCQLIPCTPQPASERERVFVQQCVEPPNGPGGWMAFHRNGSPVMDEEGIPIRWATEEAARAALAPAAGETATEATVHELWDELNKTQGDRDRFRALAERLAGAIESRNKLLACYRLHQRPSEKLLDELQANESALSDYNAAVKESGNA